MTVVRFRLLGIPVNINWSFFLVALFLGWQPGTNAGILAVWVAVVLVSVLAHEFGHALLARRYGAEPSITLYALGGLTSWEADTTWTSSGRRAAVAAIGSAVGFALGGAVYGAVRLDLVRPSTYLMATALGMFVWVNLVWGVVNWIPIRPLDGGQMFEALLETVLPRHGPAVANVLFPATALVGALVAWRMNQLFAALIAGFLFVMEVQRWQARRVVRRPYQGDPGPAPGEGLLFGRPGRPPSPGIVEGRIVESSTVGPEDEPGPEEDDAEGEAPPS